MSVTAYSTQQPGGIILDLDDLMLEDDDYGIKVLTLDEATRLCNDLKRAIVEATLEIDPESKILRYSNRVFA